MSFCLFIIYRNDPGFRMSGAQTGRLGAWLRSTPGLAKAHLYAPERADDPFLDDGAPPPLARAEHMQRNKVAFDSPAALTAALNSPARAAMRKDYDNFPPFSGKVTHFPMATRVIRP